MKPQSKAVLAAGILAIGLSACFNDPVDSLQGDPAKVSLSTKFLQDTVGETHVVNVQVLDAQGNPLELSNVTLTSLDPTVITVAPLTDSVLRNVPGQTLTKIQVTGVAAGTNKVVVGANGLTDTITAIIYPVAFSGTITGTVAPGQNITITAPTGVTFSATATATGVEGQLYKFVSRSATTLVYTAGAEGSGQHVTVNGAILLGTIALPALRSSATFTVTPANEPANNAPTTGAAIAIPAAVGDSTVVFGSISGTDVDDFYSITGVAGDIFEVFVDWPVGSGTDLDIDVLLFSTAGGCCVNTAGGTSANPEHFQFTIGATTLTTRLDVNMYDTHGHAQTWPYRIRLYRR